MVGGNRVLTETIVKQVFERMDEPTLAGLLPGNRAEKSAIEGKSAAQNGSNSGHPKSPHFAVEQQKFVGPEVRFRHNQPQPAANLIGVPQRARVLQR